MTNTGEPTRRPGRPPAASRKSVEVAALALMMERGYDAVSVPEIARAAGISRTTYFRYFASKSGVIWVPFDETIARLKVALAQQDPSDLLAALRVAVLTSADQSVHDSDVWLERFWLLDRHPTLRPGSLEHWDEWRGVLAAYLAEHLGRSADSLVPMTISTAAQAVYLSTLRTVLDDNDRAAFLARFDADLRTVFDALAGLLP